MNLYKNLYFDEKNQRFSIYEDSDANFYFLYWHELKKNGIRYLSNHQNFEAKLTNKISTGSFRGPQIEQIKVLNSKEKCITEVLRNKNFNADELFEILVNVEKIAFINCSFESIEFDEGKFGKDLTFIACEFQSNFRLINCEIDGNLWMPNSVFKGHFSLKSSKVNGDVHMESSDFTGIGGVSFRGLKAKNLFLDLGIKGGDDLFWLNEMVIPGIVSLGGTFDNELQMLSHQDIEEEIDYIPYIGSLYIGKELYHFENANKTTINSKLKICGYHFNGKISIENSHSTELIIKDNSSNSIIIRDSNIDFDLSLINNSTAGLTFQESKEHIEEQGDISLIHSSIGRHLKVERNTFNSLFDLSGSAVSEVTYFENNNNMHSGKLNLHKFTSSRLLIYPEDFLLSESKFSIFSPRKFNVLLPCSSQELGDQYCSLKHWLSDSGKLEMEDIAYFHMRQHYHPNLLTKILFGGMFGWGVRLSNITVSSILLILIFALLYSFIDQSLTVFKSFSLSIQSFISSFFGKWDNYDPDGTIANIVTLESFLGVIFITVFIGAYIRKLLR